MDKDEFVYLAQLFSLELSVSPILKSQQNILRDD